MFVIFDFFKAELVFKFLIAFDDFLQKITARFHLLHKKDKLSVFSNHDEILRYLVWYESFLAKVHSYLIPVKMPN